MTTIGIIGGGKDDTEMGHDITDPVVRPTAGDM
jgi:hypothetical protein